VTLIPIDSTAPLAETSDPKEYWEIKKDAEADKGFFLKITSEKPRLVASFSQKHSSLSRYSSILRLEIPFNSASPEPSDSQVLRLSVVKQQSPGSALAGSACVGVLVVLLACEIRAKVTGSRAVRLLLAKGLAYATGKAVGSKDRLGKKVSQVQAVRFIWLIVNLVACLGMSGEKESNSEFLAMATASLSSLIWSLYLQNCLNGQRYWEDKHIALIAGGLGCWVSS
jgi:hypothetical protein